MSDPIVDEVRRFRMDHTRKCKSDLDLICEDLRKIQEGCGHKVVRLPAVRHQPTTASNGTS